MRISSSNKLIRIYRALKRMSLAILILLYIQPIFGCYYGFGGFGLPIINTGGLTNTGGIIGGNTGLGGTNGILGGGGVAPAPIPIVPDDPSVFLAQASARFQSPQLQQAALNALTNPQLQQTLTNLLNNPQLRNTIEQLLSNPQVQQQVLRLASDPRFRPLVDRVLGGLTPQVIQTLNVLNQSASTSLLPSQPAGLVPLNPIPVQPTPLDPLNPAPIDSSNISPLVPINLAPADSTNEALAQPDPYAPRTYNVEGGAADLTNPVEPIAEAEPAESAPAISPYLYIAPPKDTEESPQT